MDADRLERLDRILLLLFFLSISTLSALLTLAWADITPKENLMAKIPTMEEIVQRGVKEQALIDKHLELARKAANRYAELVVKPAVEIGMIPKALDAKKMLANARSLPGKIAEAAQRGADLHISGTAVAVANGVDSLGSPATVGGVTLGGIHTDGGGGR